MTIRDKAQGSTRLGKDTTETQKQPTHPKRYIPMLAFGDAIAFLAFATIGLNSHGKEVGGFAVLPQVILTALPFAIAWFIVAPFAGAYRRELIDRPRKMAQRTIIAWALSWPLAMAFRGIFVDHAIPPLSFAIVTLIFNMLILLLWRWPFALNNNNKERAKRL